MPSSRGPPPSCVCWGRQDRLAFLELDVDNLSGLQYNAMFTTREFWELVNATHALVFQTDAWMCEDSTLPLDAFLEYDYVGAPAVNHFLKIKKAGFQNGGFSLRNVDAMKRTIDMCGHVRRKDGEDVFFSTPAALPTVWLLRRQSRSALWVTSGRWTTPASHRLRCTLRGNFIMASTWMRLR